MLVQTGAGGNFLLFLRMLLLIQQPQAVRLIVSLPWHITTINNDPTTIAVICNFQAIAGPFQLRYSILFHSILFYL